MPNAIRVLEKGPIYNSRSVFLRTHRAEVPQPALRVKAVAAGARALAAAAGKILYGSPSAWMPLPRSRHGQRDQGAPRRYRIADREP